MSTDDVFSKAGPDAVATTGEYQTSWEQYQHGEWPYAVTPVNPNEDRDAIILKNGKEYAFEAENGEVYQGVHPRQMVENAAVSDQPIWLGYDTNNREVHLRLGQIYRGLFIGGYTGTGKTTTASNILVQLAILGYGWLFVDPGGEEIYHLYRRLPEAVADRLVYINPAADIYDQVTGINYFNTIHAPDEPGFDAEVENIVDDILPLLEAEYPRMKGIAENMLRALIKMNSEEEHDYRYCPIDLLFALSGEEERQSYANFVDQEKLLMLEPYAKKIAEAVDEDLEPLLRRLKSWVESPLVRAIVCQRESDIDLGKAIDDNLCIVVNADTGDERSRKFLSSALQRKVWSASSTRLSKIERKLMQFNDKDAGTLGNVPEDEDFKPFFTLSDEFHALADDAMNIGETLAMARKKRQGNILMTQQLNQLTDDQQDQIAGNTSKLAFHPGDSPDEQRALAKAFPGKEKDDLMLDDYNATFIAKDSEGKDSEPFAVHMFPLYPPRRTWEEAHEKIQQSLEKYGSNVLTDEEVLEQIPEHFSGAITSDMVQTADAHQLTAEKHHTVVATAHSMARRQRTDAIPTTALVEQLLQDEVAISEYQVDNWIEKLVATDHLAYDRQDGEQYVSVTDDGLELIYDSGDSGSSGKRDHRKGVSETLDSLVHPDVGYHAEIVKQDGTELHDLGARLPLPSGGDTYKEAKANRDQIRNDHPNAYALAGERDVAVEFEKGTLDNPHQVAENLAKALNRDDPPHVLFVVEQGENKFAAKAKALTRKLTENTMTSLRVPADVDRKFWTAGKLTLETKTGTVLGLHTNPNASVEWVERDGEIVLRDSTSMVVPYDGLSPSSLPAIASETDDGLSVFKHETGESHEYGSLSALREDYKVLYEPFIPENEFEELPDDSEWSVAVNPDRSDIPLQVYDAESGGVTPITKLADQRPSAGEPDADDTGTIDVSDETGMESRIADDSETRESNESSGTARERFEKLMTES